MTGYSLENHVYITHRRGHNLCDSIFFLAHANLVCLSMKQLMFKSVEKSRG